MKKSYYAVIPADVRYDKRLRANEKLLYGEITALCNEKGYCWSTNNYFAELYGVNKNTISNWIKNLVNNGYLRSELIYEFGTKNVKERRLYLVVNPKIEENIEVEIEETYPSNDGEPINQKMDTLSIKNGGAYPSNDGEPINQKVEENNTINNTSNNTLNRISSAAPKKFDSIIKNWNSLDKNIPRLLFIKEGSDRHKLTNARINEYSEEDVIKAIKNINRSNFLKGYVNDFVINYDWFIRPNNFIKVLEGNYDDKDGLNIIKDKKTSAIESWVMGDG